MKCSRVFSSLISAIVLLPLASAVQSSQNATFIAAEIATISTCGIEKCLVFTVPAVGCTLLNTTCQCSTEVVHRLTQITADCMYANCTITEALELAKVQAAICDFPYESHNQFLKVMTIVCAVITYTVVILRLATRYILGQQLGKDDYFIIAAAASDSAFTILGGRLELDGFGNHIWTINADIVPQLFLWFWLCEILYVITIALIKYSILFFYLRVFPKRSFRITCYITMGFCTLSAIAFVLVTTFQCTPIKFIWERSGSGKCLNYNATAFANAGINIVQDIIILVIPLSEVWHLQLTTKKKFGMICIFSVGGLVCILSMVRLNSLKSFGLTSDPTWDNVNVTFWTTLETTFAIVCACMPALRALGVRYFPKALGTTHNTNFNTAKSGIMMSHSSNIHNLPKSEEPLPETREWRISKPTLATLQIVGDGTSFHNFYDSRTTSISTDIDRPVVKDGASNISSSLLDATMNGGLYLDKSLPATPNFDIPAGLRILERQI